MSSCRELVTAAKSKPGAALLARVFAKLVAALALAALAQGGLAQTAASPADKAVNKALNKAPARTASTTAQFAGIGRAATPKEVAAWDIDVRADFKGLPAGSGTVAQGQDVWEAKCAACHGVFGESNEVFTPLVGGTTAEDVKTGRVASLKDNSYPGRTTLMKVATVSTLWDYINRAMPWNAPKSLSADEVYAVTAFLLNLGGVVPDNFTLSNTTMGEAQARLPNRLGMTAEHGLWPTPALGGKPQADIKATACMVNCGPPGLDSVKLASSIPDYARNAHGNLAHQNRLVGAQHGVDTTLPAQGAASLAQAPAAPVAPATPAAPPTPKAAASSSAANPDGQGANALRLASQHSCTACHAMGQKIVGPAFADIAKKYPDKSAYLAEKIVKGGVGVWGAMPMPPQAIKAADAQVLANWLATGAAK
jgi:S-disulfanyl-L-cysteine oxidoreductase SoxD